MSIIILATLAISLSIFSKITLKSINSPSLNGFNNEFLYPVLLGAVFAVIGTPCSTPILASIMAFATISAKISHSVIMLFLFSLGQGVIMILAGVITSKLKTSGEKFYEISEKIMKVSGILLILVALFIYYKIFSSAIAG